jgi:hypothetical protein
MLLYAAALTPSLRQQKKSGHAHNQHSPSEWDFDTTYWGLKEAVNLAGSTLDGLGLMKLWSFEVVEGAFVRRRTGRLKESGGGGYP